MTATGTTLPSEMTPTEIDSKDMSSSENMDLIDVRYLLRVLARWSWVIVLATAFAVVKGAMDMHDFSPAYTAKMTVKPVESGDSTQVSPSQSGGGSGLLGALGGLQFNISRSASEFDLLMHRASSISMARLLDQKYNMMELVFGAATLEAPVPQVESMGWRQRLRIFLKYNPPSKPTLEDLAKFLKGGFRAQDDDGSPFKVIRFSHGDPDKALWYLQTIFDEAVTYLRTEFEAEAAERREFLDSRLAETVNVELRRDLLGLISSEIRKEMMSHGDLPVGAQIVDGAFVSKYRTEPNAFQYIGVPSIIGFVVTTGLIVLIALYRAE